MKLVINVPDPVEVSLVVYGMTTRGLYDMVYTDKGKFVNIEGGWRRLPDRHNVHSSDYSYTGKCGCWACHRGITGLGG